MNEKTVSLPLFILYHNNGSVNAMTKMQKLCWLIEQQQTTTNSLFGDSFEFEWEDSKWGPVSNPLYNILQSHIDREHITKNIQKTKSGYERQLFHLTESGEKLVESLISDNEYNRVNELTEQVVNEYGSKPVQRLLLEVSKKNHS